MCDVIRDVVVKVRKARPCVWCGQRIEQGESCKVQTLRDDGGDLQSNPYHPECHKAMVKNYQEAYDCEFSPYDHERPSK